MDILKSEMLRRPVCGCLVWLLAFLVFRVSADAEGDLNSAVSMVTRELRQSCLANAHLQKVNRRCQAVFRRLQNDKKKQQLKYVDSEAYAKLAWGMPGCPVERKYQDGVQKRCNTAEQALRLLPKPSRILYMVDDAMNWQHFSIDAVLSCSSSCLFVGQVNEPAVPDALVFDCLQDPRTMRRALSMLGGQGPDRPIWVYLCMESDANVVRMRDESFLRQFDIVATCGCDLSSHRRSVDLSGAGLMAPSLQHSLGDERAKEGLVVWVASNCAPGRLQFVSGLMQMLRIDSYGKCLHNRDFPSHQPLVFGSAKIPLFARYKFALSLENSISEDYVTEKFYQPLIAGAVPIYMGAPNVEDFAPSPDAFIDLRRFQTVEALAEYILYLDRNSSAYEELRAWRSRPLPARFREQAGLGFNQGSHYGEMDMRQDPCRICQETDRRLSRRRDGAAPM